MAPPPPQPIGTATYLTTSSCGATLKPPPSPSSGTFITAPSSSRASPRPPSSPAAFLTAPPLGHFIPKQSLEDDEDDLEDIECDEEFPLTTPSASSPTGNEDKYLVLPHISSALRHVPNQAMAIVGVSPTTPSSTSWRSEIGPLLLASNRAHREERLVMSTSIPERLLLVQRRGIWKEKEDQCQVNQKSEEIPIPDEDKDEGLERNPFPIKIGVEKTKSKLLSNLKNNLAVLI